MRKVLIAVGVIVIGTLQAHAISGSPKAQEIGDLICNLAGQENGNAEILTSQSSAVRQNMLCIFRNNATGMEETYHGSFQRAGRDTKASPGGKTLLFRVSITADTKVTAGLLGQRYKAEASDADKTPNTIAGDNEPSVSLLLVTETRDDETFLGLASFQLRLIASSA